MKIKMKKILSLIVLATFIQGVGSAIAGENLAKAELEILNRKELAKAKEEASVAENAYKTLGCEDKDKSPQCVEARGVYLEKKSEVTATIERQAASSDESARQLASGQDAAAQCDKDAEEYKNDQKLVNEQGLKDDGMGTPDLRKCVILSKGNLRNAYKSGQKGTMPEWKDLIKYSEICINDALKECKKTPNAPVGLFNTLTDKCYDKSELKNQIMMCDGAAYLISTFDRDWTNSEHVKAPDVKGGNPEIKCTSQGVSTIDYEGCVKFVQNGDIMDAAQTAVQGGQELYYQDKAMTAQMKAASSTESATAGLEALKTGVKGQEDIMTQRAALNTGKFAALVSYYSEIPTRDDLEAKCSKYYPADKALKNGCTQAAGQQHLFAILMNQQAKEKMKARLAKVGIDVASNAMMAALMAKRGKDINNAIAKIDEFKPIDPLAPAADNLQSTYCQQNPGDAKCLTGGLDRTFDAMGDNVITFGEGGTGTSYSNTNPFTDPTAGTIDSNSPGSKNSIASVGSVISSAQQNGGLETKAAAATVSKGSAPAGGGGGGGSGGGVGGGGGGGVPGAQPQGGTSAAIQGRTPTYGGGTGTLSMMGGYGINKKNATAKDDSNPFGKLFNKDGNKSGVVNFQGRSPANVGNKGDNIFDMISKRYTTVSSDKRLLEYELTK